MTKQEEGILKRIQKTSTIVAAISALTFAATASFGAIWTHFLRDRVDERIDTKVGRNVEFIMRVLQEQNPDAYKKAIEREQLLRKGNN